LPAVLKLTAAGPSATTPSKMVCENIVIGNGQEEYLLTKTDKNARGAFKVNLLNMVDIPLIRTGFEGGTEEAESY